MTHRVLAAASTAALILTGLATNASAAPTAELIDVHAIRAYKNPAPPASGANCSNDGAATGSYALTGWKVGGARTAIVTDSSIPSNLSRSATVSALQSSFSVWSSGTRAPSISVTTGGTTAKPTANRTYEVMWGKAGGTSLAVTYTWRWSDGTIESDTIFNTSFTWANLGSEGDGCYETAGGVYDVANIATHEFGHTYGLDHPSGARFETMYAYGYSGETLKRSPASGDINGINAIY